MNRTKLSAEESSGKLPLGRSKLGGHPDLPASIAWPAITELNPSGLLAKSVDFFENNGHRMELPFVCQLNLAEIDNAFAKKGMLYFFTSLFSDDLGGVQAVLFYEGNEALVRREHPLDTKAMGIDAAYPLPEFEISADEDQEEEEDEYGVSQLFGEPEEIQERDDEGRILLLQLSGMTFEPAFQYVCSDGSMYFTMLEEDLRKKDFSRVVASLDYT
jgi:uncharacterized protein YwqG